MLRISENSEIWVGEELGRSHRARTTRPELAAAHGAALCPPRPLRIIPSDNNVSRSGSALVVRDGIRSHVGDGWYHSLFPCVLGLGQNMLFQLIGTAPFQPPPPPSSQ